MPSVRTYPYLRPQHGSIQTEDWRLRVGGLDDVLEEMLPYWDPTTPLRLARRITVNADAVRADCQLGQRAVLRAALVWSCPGTGLRGRGSIVDLGPGDEQVVELALDLDGALLSDRVHLETQILLARAAHAGRLGAHQPGSILWSDPFTVLLEGASTRFPSEWLDFCAAAWLPADAGWFLDWDPDDLHAPVLAGLQLKLNSNHEAVRAAVSAIQPLAVEKAIRNAIWFDVARTLIVAALDNPQFGSSTAAFEEGSIGAAIRRLIRMQFPGDTVEGLAQYRRSQPLRFEALLQDRLRLFHGVWP